MGCTCLIWDKIEIREQGEGSLMENLGAGRDKNIIFSSEFCPVLTLPTDYLPMNGCIFVLQILANILGVLI